MDGVLTNEWTPVREAYPPAGRVVLVAVARPLKSGNIEMYHDIAIWNGVYWIDERTMTRKRLGDGESITDWYIFDRYRPRTDE